jgi:stromal membrane-associated protein
MENGGNAKVNAVYEAHLRRAGVAKPDNTANGQQRERYIRDKYERRKFYDPAALENYEPDDDEEEEQVLAKPARRPTATKTPVVVPISRAPSEAARRQAEARQARVAAGVAL